MVSRTETTFCSSKKGMAASTGLRGVSCMKTPRRSWGSSAAGIGRLGPAINGVGDETARGLSQDEFLCCAPDFLRYGMISTRRCSRKGTRPSIELAISMRSPRRTRRSLGRRVLTRERVTGSEDDDRSADRQHRYLGKRLQDWSSGLKLFVNSSEKTVCILREARQRYPSIPARNQRACERPQEAALVVERRVDIPIW